MDGKVAFLLFLNFASSFSVAALDARVLELVMHSEFVPAELKVPIGSY